MDEQYIRDLLSAYAKAQDENSDMRRVLREAAELAMELEGSWSATPGKLRSLLAQYAEAS